MWSASAVPRWPSALRRLAMPRLPALLRPRLAPGSSPSPNPASSNPTKLGSSLDAAGAVAGPAPTWPVAVPGGAPAAWLEWLWMAVPKHRTSHSKKRLRSRNKVASAS
uniref:Uncharacterized protein n=1 Tax=Phaeomonas parva TaxID=124430 RepID=A0A7S1UKI0_9STRA|mmetsp:Transcript_9773/g.28699  ORF Transcript_9773/g.28699 Transcript_9773/m.28699 type:complete len:108 (+) Transcript_9773:195-518(+)